MEIYTTSQARANLFQLVDDVAMHHQPVYVVGKRNKAVLISEEDYSGMMETLYLHSIPGMVKSILEADKEPLEQCKPLSKIEW
jgi:antitoxin YefM